MKHEKSGIPIFLVEAHGINTIYGIYGVFSTFDNARVYAEACIAAPADGDGYHSFLVVEYILDSKDSDGTVLYKHEGNFGVKGKLGNA